MNGWHGARHLAHDEKHDEFFRALVAARSPRKIDEDKKLSEFETALREVAASPSRKQPAVVAPRALARAPKPAITRRLLSRAFFVASRGEFVLKAGGLSELLTKASGHVIPADAQEVHAVLEDWGEGGTISLDGLLGLYAGLNGNSAAKHAQRLADAEAMDRLERSHQYDLPPQDRFRHLRCRCADEAYVTELPDVNSKPIMQYACGSIVLILEVLENPGGLFGRTQDGWIALGATSKHGACKLITVGVGSRARAFLRWQMQWRLRWQISRVMWHGWVASMRYAFDLWCRNHRIAKAHQAAWAEYATTVPQLPPPPVDMDISTAQSWHSEESLPPQTHQQPVWMATWASAEERVASLQAGVPFTVEFKQQLRERARQAQREDIAAKKAQARAAAKAEARAAAAVVEVGETGGEAAEVEGASKMPGPGPAETVHVSAASFSALSSFAQAAPRELGTGMTSSPEARATSLSLDSLVGMWRTVGRMNDGTPVEEVFELSLTPTGELVGYGCDKRHIDNNIDDDDDGFRLLDIDVKEGLPTSAAMVAGSNQQQATISMVQEYQPSGDRTSWRAVLGVCDDEISNAGRLKSGSLPRIYDGVWTVLSFGNSSGMSSLAPLHSQRHNHGVFEAYFLDPVDEEAHNLACAMLTAHRNRFEQRFQLLPDHDVSVKNHFIYTVKQPQPHLAEPAKGYVASDSAFESGLSGQQSIVDTRSAMEAAMQEDQQVQSPLSQQLAVAAESTMAPTRGSQIVHPSPSEGIPPSASFRTMQAVRDQHPDVDAMLSLDQYLGSAQEMLKSLNARLDSVTSGQVSQVHFSRRPPGFTSAKTSSGPALVASISGSPLQKAKKKRSKKNKKTPHQHSDGPAGNDVSQGQGRVKGTAKAEALLSALDQLELGLGLEADGNVELPRENQHMSEEVQTTERKQKQEQEEQQEEEQQEQCHDDREKDKDQSSGWSGTFIEQQRLKLEKEEQRRDHAQLALDNQQRRQDEARLGTFNDDESERLASGIPRAEGKDETNRVVYRVKPAFTVTSSRAAAEAGDGGRGAELLDAHAAAGDDMRSSDVKAGDTDGGVRHDTDENLEREEADADAHDDAHANDDGSTRSSTDSDQLIKTEVDEQQELNSSMRRFGELHSTASSKLQELERLLSSSPPSSPPPNST